MMGTAREVKTNLNPIFSHGLLHTDMPVLADQQGLTSALCRY